VRGRLSAMEAERQGEGGNGRRTMMMIALALVLLSGAGIGGILWGFGLPPFRNAVNDLDGDPYLPVPKSGDLAGGKTSPQLVPADDNPAEEELAMRPAGDAPGPGQPGADTPQRVTQADERPAPPLIGFAPGIPVISTPEAKPPVRAELPPVLPVTPTPPVVPETQPRPTLTPNVNSPVRPQGNIQQQLQASMTPGGQTKPEAVLTPEGFVERFPAPACFWANIRSSEARKVDIEAFGPVLDAANAFDAAFTKAFGFDAQIQFRTVSQAQCAAIEFLRSAPKSADREAKLIVPVLNLKPDQAIEGTIQGAGLRSVNALLVSDDGVVQMLPIRARTGTRDNVFTVPAVSAGPALRRPKLVIVILSPQRPQALQGRARSFANEVFPELASELRRDPEGVTILRQYIRVEG
jgi:eukaryotic-like serine/threonine-protein kinase